VTREPLTRRGFIAGSHRHHGGGSSSFLSSLEGTAVKKRMVRLASIVGFGFTLFGLAILVYVIGSYLLQGGSVPGFPFLASIIAIFSGAQLFALGIIGEYLARMHFKMMERPAYIIQNKSDASSK